MKIYVICAIIGSVVFFAMVQQLGLLDSSQHSSDEPAAEALAAKKPAAPPRAKFPEELAPGAHGQPVSVATAFEPGDRPHPLAFLKPTGALHPWQEHVGKYHDEWCAERVERTELIVVVGGGRKTQLSHHTYPNGAPPITRYQYDLDVSLVEAKTGKVIAHRSFQNVPRQIKRVESWETTALGEPVSFHTVFRWVARIAKHGLPAAPETQPLITVVGD